MKQSKNNIKIAVTGGIGSGKSTVCKIIAESGLPVFSCDEEYKLLLNGGSLSKELAENFGNDILNGDGSVNRKILSEKIFGDRKKLELLNKITHPKIFSSLFKKSEEVEGIVFFEVPLLFEGNYQNQFDGVIVILRNLDERINSIVKRDKLTEEEVLVRVKNQINYEKYDFTQYYVIHNDVNLDNLCDIIREILLKITEDYK